MKRKLILVSMLLLFGCSGVLAATASDNVTVSVEISSSTQISVLPETLSWSHVPGTVGLEKNVTVTNIGSTNVTNIEAHLNTTAVESSNPLGSSMSTSYAAGGFIVLHNSSGENYHFVGRLEWNETSRPEGMVGEDSETVSWGYFRNVTNNYLWTLVNGTNETCNETNANLVIKTAADVGDNRDMSSGTASIQELTNGGSFEWATGTFGTGPLQGHCVALYYDCTKFYVYKHDYSTTFPACSNRTYLQESNLTSSTKHVLKARAFIPYGVPLGTTSNSVLTITASTPS